jgi:hypothetical protein
MTLDVSLDGEALVAVGTAKLVGVSLVLLHHVGAHLLLSNVLMNKLTIKKYIRLYCACAESLYALQRTRIEKHFTEAIARAGRSIYSRRMRRRRVYSRRMGRARSVADPNPEVFGLPAPDPVVSRSDPDPYIIKQK